MSDMPRIKREDHENESSRDAESHDGTTTQQLCKAEPDAESDDTRTSDTSAFGRDQALHHAALAYDHPPAARHSSASYYGETPLYHHPLAGSTAFPNQPAFAVRDTPLFATFNPFINQMTSGPPYPPQGPQAFVDQYDFTGQTIGPDSTEQTIGPDIGYEPRMHSAARQTNVMPVSATERQLAAAGTGTDEQQDMATNDGVIAAIHSATPSRGEVTQRKPARRAASLAAVHQDGSRPLLITPDSLDRLDFGSLEDAMRHVAARVKIDQVRGDDCDNVLNHSKGWVLSLKNAFASPYKASPGVPPPNREVRGAQAQWIAWQEKASKELEKKLGTRTKTASERYNAEQKLKCSERLQHIVTGIAECARVRVDALNESHVHELAAAPVDYYARKITNLWINYGKKLDKKSISAQGGGSRAQSTQAGIGTDLYTGRDAGGAVVETGRVDQSDGMAAVREEESQAARSGAPRRSFMIANPNERYDLTGEGDMMVIKSE
ncbi:hypothetical protein LTR36_003748 [Oleoguttula mirabilis]|uniref:Uncharacterized protein n=1 Tax=Oleoguttula mirabilis TaxID=1507867 RepID=A0AAV9JI02_9PEZI|nr:hypothetical protein LTR36_003748 [Oleoguttula mirabilis]